MRRHPQPPLLWLLLVLISWCFLWGASAFTPTVRTATTRVKHVPVVTAGPASESSSLLQQRQRNSLVALASKKKNKKGGSSSSSSNKDDNKEEKEDNKKDEAETDSQEEQEDQHNSPIDSAPAASTTDDKSDTQDKNDNSSSSNTVPKQTTEKSSKKKRKVVIIGGGWGGLSTAYALSKNANEEMEITLVEASPRVGGLVRDGFTTMTGNRPAEAGQHGFWNNYHNIYRLIRDDNIPGLSMDTALTTFAEQGQYSPAGLEAIWPVYQSHFTLPTGLAQAAFTRFLKLPLLDRITAFPLVLAFSEFDDSVEAWEKYDQVSFRDLCQKLGVSKRCYDEAFEPMILSK